MIRTEELMDGGALRVVLDAPKANILDAAMIAAIQQVFEERVRPATRLVVFEGAGDHFSFGASVQEHQADQAEEMLRRFHGLFHCMARVAVPTCALVRGQCLGGGLELAAWCSFVAASPSARVGQPEIQLGVFPPMASILLPWRAGGHAALELCVGGRAVDAERALALGVVDTVCDDPEAWWRALYDERLAAASASSLRFAERAARSALLRRLQTDLPALERLYLDELMATRDANEGIAAFLERRRPTFTHA